MKTQKEKRDDIIFSFSSLNLYVSWCKTTQHLCGKAGFEPHTHQVLQGMHANHLANGKGAWSIRSMVTIWCCEMWLYMVVGSGFPVLLRPFLLASKRNVDRHLRVLPCTCFAPVSGELEHSIQALPSSLNSQILPYCPQDGFFRRTWVVGQVYGVNRTTRMPEKTHCRQKELNRVQSEQ